jgi:methylmalonyl-CoA epimerase
MAVRGIHHVGIAVDDLDAAVELYGDAVRRAARGRERLEDQGVDTASLRIGDDHVELLASLGDETPVGKFLASRGPGMHHVAFRVDNVATELRRLAAEGVELIDETPRSGAFGTTVAFVHPRATGGVLAELVGDE